MVNIKTDNAMKYINIKSILLLAVVLAFTACSDDDDYVPGAGVSGQGFFFPGSLASIELSATESTFNVEVARSVTGTSATAAVSATVTLAATDDDGNTIEQDASSLFSIPSSVTFGADDSAAQLTIGYDPDVIGYDVYNFVLSLEGTGETTPYGAATYEFTAGASQPWTSLGMATYTEDFMTTFYGVDNVSYEVEIQENGLTPGLFRLVYPYGEAYPYNEAYDDGTADWDLTQTYYMEINACDPNAVYITQQLTGMDWGYGNVGVWSMANYYMVNGGYSLEEVAAAGYCGTYADGVITFPEATLLINMPDYSDGWYYANYNGAFRVVMPGVVLSDYSVDVVYSGKYSPADGTNYVIGNVTLGSDVSSARVALVEGKDISSAVSDIVSGSIDFVEVTASGSVSFECEESGTYSLVAVSYGNGEAQQSAYATFNYSLGAEAEETWTAQYVGDYVYTLFFGDEDDPYTDPGLVLYQSDADPNRWKIEHWGYDVDFCFTFDQTTGEIIVDDQETGYDHPYYGMVYVDDLVDYTGGYDFGYSFYAGNTFYFALIYYVASGYFPYGYETYTLTDAAAKAMARAKSQAEKGVKPVARDVKPNAKKFVKHNFDSFMFVK